MKNSAEHIAGPSESSGALLEPNLRERCPAAHRERSIPRLASRDFVPLSFAQQRLWFLDQLDPNSALYNESLALRLQGSLNVGALQETLNAIVSRHEILRTTFAAVDGVPQQVITEGRPAEVKVVDLSQVLGTEREREVQRLLEEEVRRPFNLSSDLMLRTTVLKLERAEHILLLVMHHIASDSWSAEILLREIAVLYEAFCAGKPSPLAELSIQYADFASWQKGWVQGEFLEKQLSYWKVQLKDTPRLIELPTDRPRPAVQSYRGGRQSFSLPKNLKEELQELSRREGVTLFMTLLAAFKVLLHRYTGQDDIVVGSPVAGRTPIETEGLIGCFSNTLVLRTEFSGNPTFREILGRVREVTLGADAHKELPFEKLIEELNPARDLSHTPLFQVLFAFESGPGPIMDLLGLAVSPMDVDSQTANFDLTLLVTQANGLLSASLEYNTDLFEEATIGRMLGHFETLLQGVVANPDRRLSGVPLLTEHERQQLLVEWNDTNKDYPKDRCIHQLFEEQVERTPDAVAVVFEEERLTYRELNLRANQLADQLRNLEVGPDTLVGICVGRSLETVIGLLGILKAGGAYVPLDPAFPRERVTLMLEDAQVKVIVTEQKLLRDLPEHAARTVCLDSDWSVIAQRSKRNADCDMTPQSRAYVIYTSGSTGKPKGVEVTHNAVVNFLSSMHERPGLTNQDVLLAVTTISFDIAGLELYLPLVVGAQVVLVSREVAADGARLMHCIDHAKATIMQATPATWRMLTDAGWQGTQRLKILCGGEGLPTELAGQLLERGESLWNLYGPTETTIWSAVYQVRSSSHTVPIGRPIANTQIYILDSDFQPVPTGVAGELCIGGVGVARGYLNRPELTAEKFITDPFNSEPTARLYRTGDLARYLPDGNIEYLGRMDHQVKIRGFRIELGEIEAWLSEHPALREAVVVAREDVPGDKQLIAYIVAAQRPQPTTGELRNYLQQKLPDYMIPSAFVFLESLPLTPNGKIDRRALPVPEQTSRNTGRDYVAPTQTVEHQLVHIWEELLTARPIGLRDIFFDLGGNSLLAAKMVHRIEQVCGEKLPLSTLLSGPTIEHLAKELVEGVKNRSSQAVKIQAGDSRPPFFFLHADFRGGGFYCLNLARGLGEDQPFYALPPYGLDGGPRPPTVEAMAAGYIEMLRAAEPHGPYFLGGLCHGGLVAFEMARQLDRQGEKVELVVMIGPEPSNPPRLRSVQDLVFAVGCVLGLDPEQRRKLFLKLRSHWLDLRSLYRYSAQRLAEVATLPFRQQVTWALRLAKKRILRRLVRSGKQAERIADACSQPANISEGLQQLNRAIACYVRRPYSGRVALFWPVEEPVSMPDEPHLRWDQVNDRSLGWSQIVGPVEICPVPGQYVTVVTRDVDTMANLIKVRLDEAHANERQNISV